MKIDIRLSYASIVRLIEIVEKHGNKDNTNNFLLQDLKRAKAIYDNLSNNKYSAQKI